MMFGGLAISFFALCIGSIASRDISLLNHVQDQSFLKWCAEFCESKSDEYLARIYPTWRENADLVEKHNLPYSLSLNKFAHLSVYEFSRRYLQELNSASENCFYSTPVHSEDPPDSVDWRTKGVVPPVQNQGQCGDAVVVQVVHAVDSLHAIETGSLELASVEEYIDCCTNSCEGVLYGVNNYECIVKHGGLALESEYKSPNHVCLNNTFKPAIKINGGKTVVPEKNETALAYAVAMQPIVTAIDASHMSFQLYQSGVYYDPDCSSTELDHVLLVVGYGSENGEDYWICQNSWGSNWGMNGYILMSRNKENNCGIATYATYPY